MKLAVVGTGYVGLVSGVCFASQDHDVWCLDVDGEKIAALRQGRATIHEPGLEDLLREQIAADRIHFLHEWPELLDVDVAMIGVGTPAQPDGSADLSGVFSVALELAARLRVGAVVCTKSTVPVGTGDKVEYMLREAGRGDLHVASAPEFLREGSAVADTLQPNRLVFGVPSEFAAHALRELHAAFDAPIVECDRRTAEMIKYASNAFLATKISFINEIANICERTGADVALVAQGMGYDPRIGASFLRAGLGYGGSCFPKDTRALVNIAGDVDYDFKLLKAVIELNGRQRLEPLRRLREWLGDLGGKTVALFGVAFKPGTDDTRETPVLELTGELAAGGAEVRLCDPVVRRLSVAGLGDMPVFADPYAAAAGADAVILVTEWPEFLHLDWAALRAVMRTPYLFDGRNVLDPSAMANAGLVVGNIGRPELSLRAGIRP